MRRTGRGTRISARSRFAVKADIRRPSFSEASLPRGRNSKTGDSGTAPDLRTSFLRERSLTLLPGQYFDKKTNLHYNYQRDCYDPATGRYCQPDPLGARGLATVQGHVPGFLDFAASWSSTRPMPGVTAAPFVPAVPEVAMEHPSIALVRPLGSSLNLYAYAMTNF